jgi:glycosyltransferase involved in cell wall biosynthesis
MSPLVSVVIPVFNAERFLEKTLLSALNQTYANYQIIIVNDGSTDSSLQIVAKLSDPRIQVIEQKNGGVASARNSGLRHASGEYVAFLDADDLWRPTKLERQMEMLLSSTDRTGLGSVYALPRLIDPEDRVIVSGVFWSEAGAAATHLVTVPVGNGSSILTRRDLALEVGGFDPTYRDIDAGGAEDLDFELKLAARFPMFVVPEYLVGYRVYFGNMSSDKGRMIRAMTAVVEKHIRLNAGLSKRSINWARGQLYTYCWFNCLRGRDYTGALKMMGRLILNDPAIARTELLNRLPRALAKRALNEIREALGHNPKSAPRPLFYEVNPLEIGPLPPEIVRKKRLSHLARDDAALLSSVAGRALRPRE